MFPEVLTFVPSLVPSEDGLFCPLLSYKGWPGGLPGHLPLEKCADLPFLYQCDVPCFSGLHFGPFMFF